MVEGKVEEAKSLQFQLVMFLKVLISDSVPKIKERWVVRTNSLKDIKTKWKRLWKSLFRSPQPVKSRFLTTKNQKSQIPRVKKKNLLQFL
jgi:hypothetical protein